MPRLKEPISKKYNVQVTASAEADIESVFDYIARNNPKTAIKWVEKIEKQIDSLECFPKHCPVIPESDELGREYRHLVFGNYRTIFRIAGSTVFLLRVIHSAQLLDLQILGR